MGLIKLKAPSLWSMDTGLLASGNVMGLSRLDDYFNDGALDTANFGLKSIGSGLAVQDIGIYTYSPAAADAGIWWCKQAFDKTRPNRYKCWFRKLDLGTQVYPVFLHQNATEPQVGGSEEQVNEIMTLYVSSSNQIFLYYYDSGGTQHSWDGVAWQTGFNLFGTMDDIHLHSIALHSDGTSWWVVIMDEVTDTISVDTSGDKVPWANTRSNGDPLWYGGGDWRDYTVSGHIIVARLNEQFLTTARVATMGQVSVNAIMEEFPLAESVEAGASITWRYNKDGTGFTTPGMGTLAELASALVGMHVGALDLEATFTSDGEAAASFDINGGDIAGTGGTSSIFKLPLEAVKLPGMEVIEI